MISASPVGWNVCFTNGTMAHATEGAWNRFAVAEQHDGHLLFCTNKPVEWVRVSLPSGDHLRLVPPLPSCPVFAQARFAQCLGNVTGNGERLWLCTIFGYLLPEVAVILKVCAAESFLFTLPRPLTLPWQAALSSLPLVFPLLLFLASEFINHEQTSLYRLV